MDKTMLQDLSHLCRIALSDEEIEQFQKDLKSIIHHFDHLQETETTEIQPCNQVSETLSNVMREDEVTQHLPREFFLENSPSHIGGMIRVPPVIQF